jgi:flagellar M-ring protein FliF
VNNLREFILKLWVQVTAFWASQSATRKITVGVVAGGLVAAIATLLVTNHKDPYEYLFVDLSAEDSQQIVDYFKRNGVTNFVADSKGIKVPTDQVLSMRLQLSQEGLPAHGVVGWEKFDKQEFARTEFEQQINRLRAIQGELARTIMSIDGINGARVHIVLPKQSVFVQEQKEPTASVYIKTKRGFQIDDKQIKGIQHLVSRAVEGLKPNNISIIDQEGKLLTKIEADDFASKMTKEMLAYKQTVEKEIEEKIRSIVGKVVGIDRVDAKVDATVDFTQEEQTISDVDPDKAAVVSRNTSGESMQGTGLNPTGIPGAKSNVPGEQEQSAAAGGSSSSNKRDSELVNFEVSKTVSKKLMPVGTVKRLTAAVLVDGKQDGGPEGAKPVFEPRTEEEMKKIEELVKRAMGFKDGRDEVQVHNMMFQMDHAQRQVISMETQERREYFSTVAVSSAVAVALILFFAFIVRPYFRWLTYDNERKHEAALIEEYKPDLEQSMVQSLQVKEDVPFEKMTQQEQILYIAKNDPKRTVEAIRMILSPAQG